MDLALQKLMVVVMVVMVLQLVSSWDKRSPTYTGNLRASNISFQLTSLAGLGPASILNSPKRLQVEIGLSQGEGHCQTEAFGRFLYEELPNAILIASILLIPSSPGSAQTLRIDERDEQRRNARSIRESRDRQLLTL